ncbi:MAG: heavy metal translocating P-type ATPase [Planctomycetota bacterium]
MSAPCEHCGLPVPPGAERFCCSGCETVALFLRSNGLEAGYRALRDPAQGPATTTGRAYEELDDPSFHERYVRPGPAGTCPEGTCDVELYLEGVHCAACVWLVEKLPGLVPGVTAARLELARGLLRVRFDPSAAPLSRVARTIDGLGYAVHPYRGAALAEQRRVEDRAALVRVAIAGALAGNVMLVSFASYGGLLHGIEDSFAHLFRWIAFGLCVPAVFGPGRVFLRGGLAALRTRTPHVDLPVSLALLAGLAGGAYHTLVGSGAVYFDTVTVLVFLLLVGRFLQQQQRRKAADAAELLGSLAPASARRVEGERAREVPLEALQRCDLVEVRGGERVPCDGEVERGSSRLDASLLTGESRPARAGPGDRVHAGTVNRGGPLWVRVAATGEETRVGALVAQVEEHQRRKAPVVLWADRIAGVFVSVVLLLGALTLAIWSQLDPARALDHTVALLVVTCPCALGLATPLAIHAALGRAARAGALVKGGDVLQRLAGEASARRVFLDKTGTLSEGRHRLRTWEVRPDLDAGALEAALLGLEAGSAHPVAEGFREAFPGRAPRAVREPAALANGGLVAALADEAAASSELAPVPAAAPIAAAPIAATRISAGAPAALPELELDAAQRAALAGVLERGETPVLVALDGACAAVAGFGDALRPEAGATVAALAAAGWEPWILSGDHPRVVAAAAAALGIPPERALGGQTPEDKLARVEATRAAGAVTLMIGDGVNDAAALAAADVGVGVRGGSEATLAAADVFLAGRPGAAHGPGIADLAELLEVARDALRRVRLNLGLSLAYNVAAAGLAVAGWIDPIVAAVLMPLSSLTVVANSYGGGGASRAREPLVAPAGREDPAPQAAPPGHALREELARVAV